MLQGQISYSRYRIVCTVEKNNPEALAEAMELLFKNPELRIQMGQAGRKRFEALFTEVMFEQRMKECLGMSMAN